VPPATIIYITVYTYAGHLPRTALSLRYSRSVCDRYGCGAYSGRILRSKSLPSPHARSFTTAIIGPRLGHVAAIVQPLPVHLIALLFSGLLFSPAIVRCYCAAVWVSQEESLRAVRAPSPSNGLTTRGAGSASLSQTSSPTLSQLNSAIFY
jgi:hypothetical protein